MQAREKIDLAAAERLLESSQAWAAAVMARLRRVAQFPADARVLDIGAAQGRVVLGLQKLGYRACGVEPAAEAREIARQLAATRGGDPDAVVEGFAEKLPFPDASFDVVISFSVMEHVLDCQASFNEAYRVLAPGGVFWFSSTNALCPRQHEIRGFPLFGWYPDPIKQRIMRWALRKRPDLIGHTTAPAINWFTPRKARRMLEKAGFRGVWDTWDLRLPEEGGAAYRLALRAIQRVYPLRLAAFVISAGSAFAATKPG